MPIAKKSRLAVAALLELARHSQPHPLPQLSRRLRVSVSYLELLFGGLRRNGLVLSTRGPGGGYRLTRSAATISVLDVVAAIDELDADSTRVASRCRTGAAAGAGEVAAAAAAWCAASLQPACAQEKRLGNRTAAATNRHSAKGWPKRHFSPGRLAWPRSM